MSFVIIFSSFHFISYKSNTVKMNLRGFDKKCCEDFQNSLNEISILKIWKNFREAGNSI